MFSLLFLIGSIPIPPSVSMLRVAVVAVVIALLREYVDARVRAQGNAEV